MVCTACEGGCCVGIRSKSWSWLAAVVWVATVKAASGAACEGWMHPVLSLGQVWWLLVVPSTTTATMACGSH